MLLVVVESGPAGMCCRGLCGGGIIVSADRVGFRTRMRL